MRRGSGRAHPDEPRRQGSSTHRIPCRRGAPGLSDTRRNPRDGTGRDGGNTRSACPARRKQWAGRIAGSQGEAVAAQEGTDTAQATSSIEEQCSPLRSSAGWGLTPNWPQNQNQLHRCRLTASRSSSESGSFGCTPAPYGNSPEPTPRWVAPYTWGCCRDCSTMPRPPVDNPTHKTQGLSARLDPFVEPELCLARLAASRRSGQ